MFREREIIDYNVEKKPNVFSPEYVIYKNPSSSLYSSYTEDIKANVTKKN